MHKKPLCDLKTTLPTQVDLPAQILLKEKYVRKDIHVLEESYIVFAECVTDTYVLFILKLMFRGKLHCFC